MIIAVVAILVIGIISILFIAHYQYEKRRDDTPSEKADQEYWDQIRRDWTGK